MLHVIIIFVHVAVVWPVAQLWRATLPEGSVPFIFFLLEGWGQECLYNHLCHISKGMQLDGLLVSFSLLYLKSLLC